LFPLAELWPERVSTEQLGVVLDQPIEII
jgi:hypothetical protein